MARSGNRYQSILLESARLFREKGYLATSIRDIGDALDITSAALYYHFKNKEELLLAIMLVALEELRTAVDAAISAETEPNQRIKAAMRTHLRISVEYQDFAIVLLQEARHLSGEALERVVAERDSYERIWKQLFRDARATGQYRDDVDIRLLRLLTFGAINLVVTWYRKSGAYQPEEIADQLFMIATEGVLGTDALAQLLLHESDNQAD